MVIPTIDLYTQTVGDVALSVQGMGTGAVRIVLEFGDVAHYLELPPGDAFGMVKAIHGHVLDAEICAILGIESGEKIR